MAERILIVEDETALVTLLRYNLEREGFEVADVRDGEEALLAAEECPPDLILLDWMLPLVSGVEVCRQLRRRPETRTTPIIMLTARGEEVMRRANPPPLDETLRCGDISMDLASYRVRRADRDIHLGPTEFRLLRYLMEHPGRVFSREQLLDAVWGRDIYVEVRTVDVHIRRLRRALNAGGAPDFVRTVRAAGYALECPS